MPLRALAASIVQCTQELTIPDWRITPQEMKERLVMAADCEDFGLI